MNAGRCGKMPPGELGEQAGTKILIPMMIMFLGIVLIVATPAVLSMTSGM